MTVESRPALHPNATAAELVTYTSMYGATFLETELAAMLTQLLEELDALEAELNEAVLDVPTPKHTSNPRR